MTDITYFFRVFKIDVEGGIYFFWRTLPALTVTNPQQGVIRHSWLKLLFFPYELIKLRNIIHMLSPSMIYFKKNIVFFYWSNKLFFFFNRLIEISLT